MVVRVHPVTLEKYLRTREIYGRGVLPLGRMMKRQGPVPTVSIFNAYDRFPPVVPVVGGVKRSKEAVQGVPGHEFETDR